MKPYLQLGTELAEKAGEIMLKHFAVGIKKEWKSDNTPVTDADIAVNKLVIESVLKEYPTHGILGEEESLMKESEYVWVCDPIDGTIPFIHGIPTFTFSLALTQKGAPIVAIAYDPVMKRMYTADKGKGAYLNGKVIHVSPASSFARQHIGIEGMLRSGFAIEKFREALDEKGVRMYSVLSTSYEGLQVARGEFIASIFLKNNPWDNAAVKLLIDEAGGKTTDLYGNEQRYDRPMKGFVGSNGVIHDELIELINSTMLKK
ncbi:MAG TPA: inositol monophosphatase [Candidatus Acidoferrales bacterium]|nr:inositol monophosphatase [Candidatus Acidoferrales bacterium]